MEQNKVTQPNIDASTIYEGGFISEISAEQLKGNVIAIKQLINTHNLMMTESKGKDTYIANLKSENEYLKTAPFVSIFVAIVNIIGTILVATAINLLTNSSNNQETVSWILLFAGVLLNLASYFATILYPFAKKWFNKKKK